MRLITFLLSFFLCFNVFGQSPFFYDNFEDTLHHSNPPWVGEERIGWSGGTKTSKYRWDSQSWKPDSIGPRLDGNRKFFTLYKQDGITGNGWARSEVLASAPSSFNMWFGFSQYLPGYWQTDPKQELIGQWHETSDAGEYIHSPGLGLQSENGRFKLRILYKNGEVTYNGDWTLDYVIDLGPLIRSKWIDWVFHYQTSFNGKGTTSHAGLVDVWRRVDGVLTQLVHYTGNIGFPDAKGPYFKVGIYKIAWDQSVFKGDVAAYNTAMSVSPGTFRRLYYDEVRIVNNASTVSVNNLLPGNNTPVKPTYQANDVQDTLRFNHALGASELLVSEADGPYLAYGGTIFVDDVDRAPGYWKAKTRAASGRNESDTVWSPRFTVASPVIITPPPPDVIANDALNTLAFNSTYGTSEILLNENQTGFVPYPGTINVYNQARAQGFWEAKVKSASGRTESGLSKSPLFTQVDTTGAGFTPPPPDLVANDPDNTLQAISDYGDTAIEMSINGAAYVPYTGVIDVGDLFLPYGYYQFRVKAAGNRTVSDVVFSQEFNGPKIYGKRYRP